MIYTAADFLLAQQLSQLARTTPVPVNYLWPTFFPQVSIRSGSFRYEKEIQKIHMAEFHAPDADVVSIPRRDVQFTEGTLGSIGAKRSLRTEELVEAALAGRLNQVEATDVEDLTNAIYATIEYCSLQALTEGEVVLSNGYGVSYTLDYGTHGVDTTPGVNWNVPATATPIDDIVSWSDSIKTLTNFYPSAFLTSQKQVRNILATTQVKETVWKFANATGAVSLRMLNALLSEIHGLPPIIVYDQTLTRVDTGDNSENTVRTTDEDVFIGLPPLEVASTPGAVVSGVTAEAAVAYQDVQKDLDSIAEGLWVDALTEREPAPRRRLRAKMAMIPVFPTIGQTLRAVVQ